MILAISRMFWLVLVPVLLLTACGEAQNTLSPEEAQEGWELLFDGKSTQGWQSYGGGEIEGWKAEGGELVAFGGKDIISDQQYDNFELAWDWKVSAEGNSGIFFHVKNDGAKYGGVEATGPEYQLIDDTGWPEAIEGWQNTGSNYAMHLASSRPTNPTGEWNQSKIRVNGPHVEHWLNGTKILEYELWTPEWEALKMAGKWKDYPDYGLFHRGHLALQNHGNTIWFRNIKIRQLPAYIYNGEDLSGWKIHGTEKWFVEEGNLVCESGPDSAYGYLATEKIYTDFILTLEFKQEADGNSGVFFRSSLDGTKITGWQAEVSPNEPAGNGLTGGIYESYGRGWLDTLTAAKMNQVQFGEWNQMTVKVQGDRAQTWLNGAPMADLTDEKIGQASGSIALQIHDGGGIKVRWRRLFVTEL